MFYYSRSADAHIDDRISLCHSVESSCHKRIIIWRIAKYYQLSAAKRIIFFGGFRCSQYDFTHQFNRIHIDSRFCGTKIYRAADSLRLCQRLRNGTDQQFVCPCHSLRYQRRISSDKVHAHFFCRFVKSFCQRHKVLRSFAGCSSHQSHRSDRNSFIYNRNTVFSGNIFPSLHQIFRQCGDLFIYFAIYLVKIGIHTIQKTDSQCDRSHIQIFLFDHLIGFIYLKHINHVACPPSSFFACSLRFCAFY